MLTTLSLAEGLRNILNNEHVALVCRGASFGQERGAAGTSSARKEDETDGVELHNVE